MVEGNKNRKFNFANNEINVILAVQNFANLGQSYLVNYFARSEKTFTSQADWYETFTQFMCMPHHDLIYHVPVDQWNFNHKEGLKGVDIIINLSEGKSL